MTARPFTPRDAALDLGRRTQLVRQSLTTRSTGHPLDIARAVRSLAAVRGADPGNRGPVDWAPVDRPSPLTNFSQSGSPTWQAAPVSSSSPWHDFSSWLKSLTPWNTSP